MVANNIIAEIQGLYKVVALQPFRKTEGVSFDILPRNLVPKVDAVDRVIHKNRAVSPGPVGDISEPWYMHPHQDDNLIVLQGIRYVEIYTKAHGRIESFIITPERIEHNNRILYDGPGLLVWPRGVFHRIKSGDNGSASINLATHYEGIDMKTNFNIYDVDTETGEFMVLREGHLDQTM
ncbi:MAG: hypothetical protein AMJ61_02640 [Desulfobacterales bacterium SG8_35_2]|nr:MAG: hypothetical protein AMJ61_02640 [Desulfobacterales bacterium SG8_35_2]